MNGPLLLSNLAAYSLQIGLLVAVAAVVPALVGMRTPSARLAYWHILLVACIALPLVRPWRQETVTPAAIATFSTSTAVIETSAGPAHRDSFRGEAVLWLLAAGATVRLLWLAVGLWRLRRYRLNSHPFETVYDIDIRVSSQISSPVTFGFRDPVVLVPPHFSELSPPMQQIILCHEILHIERRDWLFTMAEETIRAFFWFHPAIWWLLGQIHLTRDQTVDRRVIETTKARETYVDALLAMAGVRRQLDLAPAPLFLRKRHLKRRVVEVLKEAKMSKKRLIFALAVGVAVLVAACWLITGAIPLAASPQVVADASGVTVNLNGAQLMHRSPVFYPVDAMAKGIHGTVVVQVKLDAKGEVRDAAVQSGPDELRKTVIQSVLNWHFMNDSSASTRTVNIEFTVPQGPETAMRSEGIPSVPVVSSMSSSANAPRILRDIEVMGLSDQAQSDLLGRLPVHVGDTIGSDQLIPVMEAVRKFDRHLSFAANPNSSGEMVLRIWAQGTATAMIPPSPPPPPVIGGLLPANASVQPSPPSAPGETPQRIRVGGAVQAQMLVEQTQPVYPPLAKNAHVTGTVELSAIIGKDGHVTNLSVVSGHPLLLHSALQTVQNWVYKPTLLNGQPVEVLTTINVNFTGEQ